MGNGITKGRGATVNALATRFDRLQRVVDGDWQDAAETVDGSARPPATTVTLEHPRSIIARNTSPDVPFDRSINAYRGCEHGCVYCFARPTHAYHDLSPGLDFETRLFAKPAAAALLRVELSRQGYAARPIAMGTNTDPYQPIEDSHRITRAVIEVLAEFGHPFSIVTKSDRVLRDLDLIAPMAARGLVHVGVSITTLDPALARRMEPRASTPKRRLAALDGLRAAGVPVMVLAAPMIPALNDHEIEAIFAAAADAGATYASMIPIRLPHEVAPIFKDWLAAHFPDRATHVMELVRSMRGGRENDPGFGTRMRGSGAYADLLHARARAARRRFGLDTRLAELRCDLFSVPGAVQLSLW